MLNLKPMFKYQGGKRREWKYIKPLIPANTTRIVEPFCGGAAVAWLSGLPAFCTDLNAELMMVYEVVKHPLWFQQLLIELSLLKPDEETYYACRQALNNKTCVNKVQFVAYWIYVRQQCYSGLVRYNSRGEFNTPWGRYKSFSHGVTQAHHERLQMWELKTCSFEDTLYNVKPNDFVFLDPPYFKRNSNYKTNQTDDEQLHRDLAHLLLQINQPWLLIHSDCDLYREIYPEKFVKTRDFRYALQFKSHEMKQAKVQHLYITNQV